MHFRTRFIRLFFMCTISAAALVQAQTSPMSGMDKMPSQQFAQLGTVSLENGQQIDQCALGYRTLGTLNADKSNAILFPTWFTGKSAKVLPMLGAQGYQKIRQGTNGFSCIVNRDGQQVGDPALRPTCWDAEGTTTILPVMLRVGELLAKGE